MVDVDGGCKLLAPKLFGLVWSLVAIRRSVYIHQKNCMNSCNDFGHDDSTTNIVVAIIIIIIIIIITSGMTHHHRTPLLLLHL